MCKPFLLYGYNLFLICFLLISDILLFSFSFSFYSYGTSKYQVDDYDYLL